MKQIRYNVAGSRRKGVGNEERKAVTRLQGTVEHRKDLGFYSRSTANHWRVLRRAVR